MARCPSPASDGIAAPARVWHCRSRFGFPSPPCMACPVTSGEFPQRFSRLADRVGFTLIEIILVVGMLAILAAMAWPTFQSMFASARLSDCASELRTTLREARRRAIADGVAYRCDYQPELSLVRIVPSTDPYDQALEEATTAKPLDTEVDADTTFEPFRTEYVLPDSIRILPRWEVERGPQGTEESEGDSSVDEGLARSMTRAWIPLCEVYPDGSASETTIGVLDSRQVLVELSVDALTGAVEIGESRDWVADEDMESPGPSPELESNGPS